MSSIAALSQPLIRTIGSAQVLSDPTSVVKELIDNALDAGASSISVEISTNTLDVIQVKDDGCGIPPYDRGLLCRRYCTSKIRDLKDLAELGGRSLGFRGVALASAADMSGELCITTRVAGEQVAELLRFKQSGGEILGRVRCSHPPGTTVRVSNFAQNIPVRRHSLIKTSIKTISKIRELILAYALARPATRLSLKVLDERLLKFGMVYAPGPEVSVRDAAMKLLGVSTVGQCDWRIWCSREAEPIQKGLRDVVSSPTHFTFSTLFPRSSANVSQVDNRAHHFISVDRRPVCASRGIVKELLKQFRSHFLACRGSEKPVVDPFLCMDISCAPGIYDVNVDPAKDDVLFTEPARLLEAFQMFLDAIYGVIKEKATVQQRRQIRREIRDSFDIILHEQRLEVDKENYSNHFHSVTELNRFLPNLAQKQSQIGARSRLSGEAQPIPNTVTSRSASTYAQPRIQKPFQISRKRVLRSEADLEADREMLDAGEHEFARGSNLSPLLGALNPWTIAKMNASVLPPPVNMEQPAIGSRGSLMTPAKQLRDRRHEDAGFYSSPLQSQTKIGYPTARRRHLSPLSPYLSSPRTIQGEGSANGGQLSNQWTPINRPRGAVESPYDPYVLSGTPMNMIPPASERPRSKRPARSLRQQLPLALPPILDRNQARLLNYLPVLNSPVQMQGQGQHTEPSRPQRLDRHRPQVSVSRSSPFIPYSGPSSPATTAATPSPQTPFSAQNIRFLRQKRLDLTTCDHQTEYRKTQQASCFPDPSPTPEAVQSSSLPSPTQPHTNLSSAKFTKQQHQQRLPAEHEQPSVTRSSKTHYRNPSSTTSSRLLPPELEATESLRSARVIITSSDLPGGEQGIQRLVEQSQKLSRQCSCKDIHQEKGTNGATTHAQEGPMGGSPAEGNGDGKDGVRTVRIEMFRDMLGALVIAKLENDAGATPRTTTSVALRAVWKSLPLCVKRIV